MEGVHVAVHNLLLEQPHQTPCGPSIASPMSRVQADDVAGLLKAVADPVRLQLLSAIASSDAREACVCDLTEVVEVSQPTVSHHLKVLVEAGLLTRERRGSWAWFALVPERLEDITSPFR